MDSLHEFTDYNEGPFINTEGIPILQAKIIIRVVFQLKSIDPTLQHGWFICELDGRRFGINLIS